MSDCGIQWWQELGYQQIEAEEYHATDAVSASLLKSVDRSPAHATVKIEPTAAMDFGTAFHAALLEPEKFNDTYAVFDGDKRTKDGKAQYESLIQAGKTTIKPEDLEAIEGMSESIRLHESAGALMKSGVAELSRFWMEGELMAKCRPDWAVDSDTLIDIKTTTDASPAGFARAVANFKYHMQAAWYMRGTGASRFYFIAVETKPPYAVGVYELDRLSLDEGESRIERALDLWRQYKDASFKPAYSPYIIELSLPSWALKGEQE